MILHIIFDQKFSDYVYARFHSPEMKSKIVLCAEKSQIQFFHYADDVQVVNPANLDELEQLLFEISHYDAVIFHGLYYPWQEWLLSRIPVSVKVAWMFWGGEIYGQRDVINTFLTRLSKIVNSIHKIHCFCKNKKIINDYVFPKQLIKRVDYCLTDEREEAEYAQKYLHKDIQYIWYSYYNIEETIGVLKDKRSDGDNIFLGNSATIENNHFDALFRLKRLGIGNRTLITPLSYGNIWEKNACARVGNLLFGRNFVPLVDFIPREEYNAQMLSCSIMIQPHWRPNAHGNIITALWLGMRVYLSEHNMEYTFFRRIGCVVFSIEKDLRRSNPNVFDALPHEDVIRNREILESIYGEQNMQKSCKVLVNKLCSDL